MKNVKLWGRKVKAGGLQKDDKAVGLSKAEDVLREAQFAWESLREVRKKIHRSVMYSFEDQWGDIIRDPDDGQIKTEGQYIMKQGKVPLKNNVIRPIVKNIEGQFRQNVTRPVCVVRDQRESKLGEMMSIAIEYVNQINEEIELDASLLVSLMVSGFCAKKINYGFNSAKQNINVWTHGVNPFRFFFNTNVEDVRGWDMNILGEIFDMPLKDVIANFAKSEKDRDNIKRIYGTIKEGFYLDGVGMTGTQNKDMDFYTPSRTDLCRVILVWKKESREAIFWHDNNDGTWGYVSNSERNIIEQINAKRKHEALLNGVEPEDILLIDYKWEVEQYWYYRYLSPRGDILLEGRSPYWHKEHNYVVQMYPLVHGKIYNFIEDFIDQQRSINRTLTLIDFIRGASAKGLVVVDETAFEGMSREKIIDEYVRYNGVLFATLKQGQNIENVIKQYNGNASVAGDYELVKLQLQLINDIAGVNSAMQGKAPTAGTPAALYAQQVQNSSLNIKGLLDSFRNFRLKCTNKTMKTIQQYYTSARYIDLAGQDYDAESKWYDPEKVQDAEVDASITEGANTPVYQMVINDMLMQLFNAHAINVKQMLENSSLPFASRILESIKRDEQAIQEAQTTGGVPNIQGIPPELMQQYDTQNPQTAGMINKSMN